MKKTKKTFTLILFSFIFILATMSFTACANKSGSKDSRVSSTMTVRDALKLLNGDWETPREITLVKPSESYNALTGNYDYVTSRHKLYYEIFRSDYDIKELTTASSEWEMKGCFMKPYVLQGSEKNYHLYNAKERRDEALPIAIGSGRKSTLPKYDPVKKILTSISIGYDSFEYASTDALFKIQIINQNRIKILQYFNSNAPNSVPLEQYAYPPIGEELTRVVK